MIKSSAFFAVNATAALIFLGAVDSRYRFEQYESDSILLSTPKNTQVDVVIMGTSRARVLTRVKCSCEAMQRELGRTCNLAIPFGGGIVPGKIYLANFFREGNRTKTVLFFIDPFTLFSPQPNKQHRLVYYEPFRPWFLLQLARNGFPLSRIAIYVQSKFTWRYLTQAPGGVSCDHQTVAAVDPEKVKARVESLYFDGLNETYFRKYAGTLREILQLAQARGARVVLALPPTLLGPQPGADRLMRELEELKQQFDFEFRDYTDAIPDRNLYSDYDHLNSEGVAVFARMLKELTNVD